MATMTTASLTYGKARVVSGHDDNNGGKSGIKKGEGKDGNDDNDDGECGISKARVAMMATTRGANLVSWYFERERRLRAWPKQMQGWH
jgi:hypothetical protein